jgi:hypothetical protein
MTAAPFDTLRYSGCGCHNGRMIAYYYTRPLIEEKDETF